MPAGCTLFISFFAGFNGTIFAYGQTGTGKTFTMVCYAKMNLGQK
jgi:hypothetical protein